MPDVIPPMNLAPEATAWGRAIQNLVVEMQRNLARSAETGANGLAAAKSSNRVTTTNVQTLQGLTTGLQAQMNALFASGIVTTTVAASGAVNAGSLSVSGSSALSGGLAVTGSQSVSSDLTVGGLIRNVAAYSNPITTGFRNLFVTNVDGQFGFNLSSRKHKQDIQTAIVDPTDVLLLRLVTYRYIQAVETYGDAATVEYGLIAEEVEAAGLGWLVDYDDDGKPLTLKFHLLAMALLPVAQDFEQRIAALEIARKEGER